MLHIQYFTVPLSHKRVFSLAPASKRVVQGLFDESSRLLPAFLDEVDASGRKHTTVDAMIGCCAILPTPRPHSANRPATALLLVGVSAPFAHSPITCVDHSGSLRTPKETSGTLALLPPRTPIFAHDPSTAAPAPLTSTASTAYPSK